MTTTKIILTGMTFALFLFASTANAEIRIDVGNHEIAAAPGQRIELFVTSTDTLSDPKVTGFNLRTQIGDGTTVGIDEPTITQVDFNGGIWSGRDVTITGGPILGSEQFAQSSIVFNSSTDSILADGLLLTLEIDGSGFPIGAMFDLNLASTDIGADSVFIARGGTDIAPVITNGSITIGVPEPSAAILLAISATLAGFSRHRNRLVSFK